MKLATAPLAALVLSIATACAPAAQEPAAATAKAGDGAPAAAAPAAAPAAAAAAPATAPVAVEAKIGAPAPDFELADLDGAKVKLSDLRGKLVVLEWFNPECPFVKYAHGEGPLKTMAKDVAGDDLVWLAINSGAPGKQGHGVETNRAGVTTFGMAHPVLLDETGEVGRRYGASKTPHVFVVGTDGTLLYMGGVDNAPMGEPDGGELKRYLADALAAIRGGKPVADAETKAYGCSVKYAS